MKRFMRTMYKVNRNLYSPYSLGFIHHHIPQLFSRPSASCSSDFQMPFIAFQFKDDFFQCSKHPGAVFPYPVHQQVSRQMTSYLLVYLLLVTDDASSNSRLTWDLYLLNRCPQPLLCPLYPPVSYFLPMDHSLQHSNHSVVIYGTLEIFHRLYFLL